MTSTETLDAVLNIWFKIKIVIHHPLQSDLFNDCSLWMQRIMFCYLLVPFYLREQQGFLMNISAYENKHTDLYQKNSILIWQKLFNIHLPKVLLSWKISLSEQTRKEWLREFFMLCFIHQSIKGELILLICKWFILSGSDLELRFPPVTVEARVRGLFCFSFKAVLIHLFSFYHWTKCLCVM